MQGKLKIPFKNVAQLCVTGKILKNYIQSLLYYINQPYSSAVKIWFKDNDVTDTDSFKWLWYRLQEEADVRLAIQEALSMMVGAYANLQGALLNLMEALVAAYIGKVGIKSKCHGKTYLGKVGFEKNGLKHSWEWCLIYLI